MRKLSILLTIAVMFSSAAYAAQEQSLSSYLNKQVSKVSAAENNFKAKQEANKQAADAKKAELQKKQETQKQAVEQAKQNAQARQEARKNAIEQEKKYWSNVIKK